ncbi:MAG: hypothetical protein Q8P67_27745 [archaeon]|nr:hypothetical protein [archaeon]
MFSLTESEGGEPVATWRACSTPTNPLIPSVCAEMSLPDSCNAVLSFSLANSDTPFATQEVPIADLLVTEGDDPSSCASVGLGLAALGCSDVCISITLEETPGAAEPLACPHFNTSDCPLFPTLDPVCKPAPQLERPCDNSTGAHEHCPDDCSDPLGACDGDSGYCFCSEDHGGANCSLSCDLGALLQAADGRQMVAVPMFTSPFFVASSISLSAGVPVTYAVEIASQPVRANTDLEAEISLSGAFAEALVSSASPFALSASQGCPDFSPENRVENRGASEGEQPHTADVMMFDPFLVFPLPPAVEVWFLTLSSTENATVSLAVVQPWLYTVPVEVLATSGISTMAAPSEQLYFRVSLNYPTPLTLLIDSDALPIAAVAATTTSRVPSFSTAAPQPGNAMSASLDYSSDANSSTWTFGVLLADCAAGPSSSCQETRLTVRLLVTPDCFGACPPEHGQCALSGACECSPGWTGGDCMSPDCSPSCGPHGACSAPGVCTCEERWSGPYCIDLLQVSNVTYVDTQSPASTIYDILLPPMLILSFILIVPTVFWLLAQREKCLAQPSSADYVVLSA